MGELEYNTSISRLERGKDIYRVHDTSKKQKKQKRGEDEKEFMDLLGESEKEVEDFNQAPREERTENVPANKMLDSLGMNTPPPIIEIDEDEA